MRRAAVALIHHPVLGREGQVLTTTVTNLDVHDLARAVCVYGLEALYVVHPLASQRMVVERIQHHWVSGAGGRRIPDRRTALERVKVVADLEAASADLAASAPVELWATAAKLRGGVATTFGQARALLEADGPAVMVCFGTGWGLSHEFLAAATLRLEPLSALRDSGYNHLSVRAACAITLDRLLG
jgi:hypothetical protein